MSWILIWGKGLGDFLAEQVVIKQIFFIVGWLKTLIFYVTILFAWSKKIAKKSKKKDNFFIKSS